MRVLLLEMPKLLRGLLEHAVQLNGECELLRETRPGLQMLTEPAPSPDVIMFGLTEAQDVTLVPALFARWPRVQVVTVTEAGDHAAVYELMPRRRALGQMSPDEIVETLRETVQENRELAPE